MNPARALLDSANGSLSAAVALLTSEWASPQDGPKRRYDVDSWGRIVNCPELDELGYKGIFWLAPFVLEDRACDRRQGYNIETNCGCAPDGTLEAAAFHFVDGQKIGAFAPTRWDLGPRDPKTDAVTAVDDGYFVDRTIPTRFTAIEGGLDAMLRYLKANPIDFTTRAGGPVADHVPGR